MPSGRPSGGGASSVTSAGPVDELADRAAGVAAVRAARRAVEARVEDERVEGEEVGHLMQDVAAPAGIPGTLRRVRIDHVIWATTDLDAAAERLERSHGLRAAGGGRHDGMGTHNRIVPLGGGYLELLAVADAEEAAGSALGRAVTGRLASVGEGLMGWAVAIEDVTAVAARLGTGAGDDPAPGVRRPADRRRGGDGRAGPAVLRRARPRRGRSGRRAATPAGSPGSRWPATRRGSRPGWAAPRSPSACGRERPR